MACIEYPLCKYAHYENGALVCATGAPCAYQRYCSTLLKVIHTSAYKTCKEVKNMANANKKKTVTTQKENVEINNKEVEVVAEEVVENKNIIEKSEICEARYDDGLIYINFKGYGLITPNIKNYKEPQIKVFYDGEIGTADFKFRV